MRIDTDSYGYGYNSRDEDEHANEYRHGNKHGAQNQELDARNIRTKKGERQAEERKENFKSGRLIFAVVCVASWSSY
jgi:hypothetical protein